MFKKQFWEKLYFTQKWLRLNLRIVMLIVRMINKKKSTFKLSKKNINYRTNMLSF